MSIQEFKDFIRDCGLIPPDHIPVGKIVAFAGLNKPPSNKAARCFIFNDGQGGWLMDYTTGQYEVWLAGHTKPDQQTYFEQWERDKLAREQKLVLTRQRVAEKARAIWESAVYAPINNAYLARKQVPAYTTKTGATGSLKDVLIVPLYNRALHIVNLQFIQADGQKRFLKGGQKKDCFFWLGTKTDTVLIAEGYATGASLYQVTDNLVFIAFDAGNLINVAKIVRGSKPDADIIICGDNDKSGVGQKAARQAALAVSGRYMIPPTEGYDWNDAINAGGVL